MNIFSFMMQKPVTGFNTINQILKPFKLQVPLDADILRPYLTIILGRQLNMTFRSLRKAEQAISFEYLDEISED